MESEWGRDEHMRAYLVVAGKHPREHRRLEPARRAIPASLRRPPRDRVCPLDNRLQFIQGGPVSLVFRSRDTK